MYSPKLLGPRPWAERMGQSVNSILPMCRYEILRHEQPECKSPDANEGVQPFDTLCSTSEERWLLHCPFLDAEHVYRTPPVSMPTQAIHSHGITDGFVPSLCFCATF